MSIFSFMRKIFRRSVARRSWTREQCAFGDTGFGNSAAQYTTVSVPMVTISNAAPSGGAAPNYIGPKTVKNMRIVLNADGVATTTQGVGVGYLLVYVPRGYTPSTPDWNGSSVPSLTSSSIYEPSNFVLQSGIVSTDNNPLRITTRFTKKLNEGDAIWLLLTSLRPMGATEQVYMHGMLSFSITD